MNNQSKTTDNNVCCGCSCHGKTMTGVAVVIFGLLFLLQALGWLAAEIVAIVWPIMVILGGIKFFCRCCQDNCSC